MQIDKISIISRVGGKYSLLDRIIPVVLECRNRYGIQTYAELCGGSAKVLTNLPLNSFKYRIYNDVDIGCTSIMTVLQNKLYTAELMTMLEKYRYSEEVFKMAINQLKLNKVKKHLSLIEVATFTFIAIFQSRASNMTTYSPSREYEMGYYDKISRLKDYYSILEGIEIHNSDCMQLLEIYKNHEDMLIYLDPPYLPVTMKTENHYGEDSWSMEHHQILVENLLQTKAKVILSGYEDRVFNTYKPLEDAGWTKILLKNMYIASSIGKSKQDEYIWINFEISSYILQKISCIKLE